MINEYLEISLFKVPIKKINDLLTDIGIKQNEIVNYNAYSPKEEIKFSIEQFQDLLNFFNVSHSSLQLQIASLKLGSTISDILIFIRPIIINNTIGFVDIVLNFESQKFLTGEEEHDAEKLNSVISFLFQNMKKNNGDFIRFGFENAYYDITSTLMEAFNLSDIKGLSAKSIKQIILYENLRNQ